MTLPAGKLPNELLARLLGNIGTVADPRVLVGPRVGEDAAVIEMGEKALVVTTDPITFAGEHLGWYAVQVNANDMATRGARPRWFLAVLLLPEKSTDERLVSSIFDQIASACADLGCALVGGHTEITIGLERPILVGEMLGEVPLDKLVTSSGAMPGDHLLLTKAIALEGTALLARERRPGLLARGVPEELVVRAAGLLFGPGISIVREALAAGGAVRVHAMHDPTEGGLATGVAEMAQAAGLGVRIHREAIPILPECDTICRALGLDPLGLLASGSLLIAVDPADERQVLAALPGEGIPCAVIGELTPPEGGLTMETGGQIVDLTTFARDEIARALE